MIIPNIENQQYRTYEHNYLNYFVDKVLYFQANELQTQTMLNAALEQRNVGTGSYVQRLAGDLEQEYLLWSKSQPTHPDVEQCVSQLMLEPIRHIMKEKDAQPEVIDVWVNFQQPKEHNPVHSHTGVFSFIWYLDIPQSIREEYKQQKSRTVSRGMIEFLAACSSDTLRFNPQTHDVFLFRSDHSHQVYPFYSDCERISLAGNINVIS